MLVKPIFAIVIATAIPLTAQAASPGTRQVSRCDSARIIIIKQALCNIQLDVTVKAYRRSNSPDACVNDTPRNLALGTGYFASQMMPLYRKDLSYCSSQQIYELQNPSAELIISTINGGHCGSRTREFLECRSWFKR
jgi:hypothetical protein